MSKVNRGRGYVYYLHYHIVWCVKYRHKILYGEVEKYLKNLLYVIAKDNDIEILEMETDNDHIHLLINCTPQHFIPSVIKAFKGVSARKMFLEFPYLKNRLWGGHLWNPSYFVATVSENTEEQIKKYIQNQQVE